MIRACRNRGGIRHFVALPALINKRFERGEDHVVSDDFGHQSLLIEKAIEKRVHDDGKLQGRER